MIWLRRGRHAGARETLAGRARVASSEPLDLGLDLRSEGRRGSGKLIHLKWLERLRTIGRIVSYKDDEICLREASL